MKYLVLIAFLVVPTQVLPSDSESNFWDWFKANELKYRSADFSNVELRESLFEDLRVSLDKVNPELLFEFGGFDSSTRELIISADGIVEVFPAVISLIEKAPKLDGWRIVAFRQRSGLPVQIAMGEHKISPESVYVNLYRDNDKYGVVLNLPGYNELLKESYVNIGFLLLDHALGEYLVGKTFSFIEFDSIDKRNENSIKLSDLYEVLTELGVVDNKPPSVMVDSE